MKKLAQSFQFAFRGIPQAIKSERNLKIHFVIMFLVILLGFLLKIQIYEWILCIICFGLVISAELFNTAIETVVDLINPNHNELAGKAKDIAAGAVLVVAIASAIIGIMIFGPKIFMH